ncbi:MAG: adenosylmethionine--8-amino-7-oxononanoate transaminase [bacterium]
MVKKQQCIWQPFTQMKEWENDDHLTIERGQGSYLIDTIGNKYLDGVSSLWVNVHGHNHPTLNRAIKKQLDKIAHSTLLGLANKPAVELAKQLVKIAPNGLTKVFYSDNGSTAVEIALKIAFQYQQLIGKTKRTKFITIKNAYHGDTIGAVSVGGIDVFHERFGPLLFKAIQVKTDLKEVEKAMKKHHQEVAAMIIEPMIQGAAGMLLQPKGFVNGIRELCTKYNILMIVDEVATGFGRTGRMFACEHDKVTPDIMCIAKGITGGYLPLAATLTTDKLYKAFLGEGNAFLHGHTYTGNPVGCAAALANLEIFKQEKTLINLQPKIKLLAKLLERFYSFRVVHDIRQLGFMVGIELKGTGYGDQIGHQVIMEARKRGAILRPLGNVIVLMPPLSISQQELKRLVKITYESIKTNQHS